MIEKPQPLSRSQAKRFGASTVTNSCGCVFCDLDLEPTLVKISEGEWQRMHVTKSGKIACTKQPTE